MTSRRFFFSSKAFFGVDHWRFRPRLLDLGGGWLEPRFLCALHSETPGAKCVTFVFGKCRVQILGVCRFFDVAGYCLAPNVSLVWVRS